MRQATAQKPRGLIQIIEDLVALAAVIDEYSNLCKGLGNLLRDPYAIPNEEEIESIKSYAINNSSLQLRSALGFFLFANAADRGKIDEANSYLDNEEIRNFIYQEYNVRSEYRKPDLVLHKVGTTSYILRIEKHLVLKIIKYRYTDNETITNATANYKNRFQHYKDRQTPYVYLSEPRFIIMDYIDGASLREYQEKILRHEPELAFARIGDIFASLCSILGRYAKEKIHHLDLSPDNILIEHEGDGEKERRTIHLIDFGYNYLLRERVGSSVAFVNTQTYVAPELLESPERFLSNKASQESQILADVYSLGVILLEMLSKQTLGNKKVPEELKAYIDSLAKQPLSGQEIAKELENHSSKYTAFGQTLIDLIDAKPERRLFNQPKTPDIYANIKKRVGKELQIYELVYLKKPERWLRIIFFILGFIAPSSRRIRMWLFELYLYKEKEFYSATIKRIRKALGWSVWSLLLNMITFVTFPFLVWHDYKNHNLFMNLPGRMVAFSFSLVSTKYYVNIFSTVSTSEIPTLLARITEICLRCSSFFCIPFAWYALFIDPKTWPICVALSSIYVILNNFFCYRFSVKARGEIERVFGDPVTQSLKNFIDEIKSWYSAFAIYGLGFYVMWYLMHPNPLIEVKDEWIYASVAVTINIKMLFLNCSGEEADRIRSGLERLIAGYSRAIRYEEHKKLELKVAPERVTR